MQIKITEKKNHVIIQPSGDLDANSSIDMDGVISGYVQQGKYNLLINCAELNYISSAGLGVFIAYLKPIQENKGHLVFTNMSEKVRNVFEILGLDKLVEIKSKEEEGAKLFS